MSSTRIAKRFAYLEKRDKKAFIPFIVAGDPDLETTEQLIVGLERIGADIIELGVPFSDSIADGPVILNAISRALDKGTTLHSIFLMVEHIRSKTEVPIVFMISYNLIYNYGINRFVRICKQVGVDGVIVPDLPVEESLELHKEMNNDIDLIYLVSPESDDNRIKLLKDRASGFIYFISIKGITGIRNEIDISIKERVQRAREILGIPVVQGFGISKQEHITAIKSYVDGVVVGSAIVKSIEENLADPDIVKIVLDRTKPLIQSLKT